MKIEKVTRPSKSKKKCVLSKGIHYDLSDKIFDPHLELLGNFFVKRMPDRECTFEKFMENPEWAFSVYGRSGQTFDKALIAG